MFLLSLSPLLSSLFVSYANRAASHRSASSTPSHESEEWKAFQSTVTVFREENERLQSENREMVLKLEAAEASNEGFRSHISSLRQVNAAQQSEVNSLRKELVETKDLYERVMKDWNGEKAAYQTRISGIQTEVVELKQSVAEKQGKILSLERQLPSLPSDNPPIRPIRQTPPQVRPGNSLTSSEASATPRLRTLSLEGGEEVPGLSSAPIHTREVDVPTPPPGLNEKVKPQPPPSKPQPQPHQQKLSRGGWLKALNDSF